MKQRISLFATALCVLFATLSTPSRAQRFEWGVGGGANLSSLIGVEDTTPRLAPWVGVNVGYLLTERLVLGTEVAWSQQGTHCNPNEAGVAVDYNYNYVNIPLLIQWRLRVADTHLRVMAGPQLGIFAGGNYSFTAPSVVGEGYVSGRHEFDGDSFHAADFGVVVGGRCELLKGRLMLDVRYAMGITQTHDGISNTMGGYYYISVPDNRNSVIRVGASVMF
ncbi:MAG: PorT family protein [Tidjanibacter sp.]|nr:PorT family protein [Tidjanibacter sp.]